MTTKFKILSVISFIALSITLTFVGVWAMTELDFSVGGDITYTAPTPQGYNVTLNHFGGMLSPACQFSASIKINGEAVDSINLGDTKTFQFENVETIEFVIVNNPDYAMFRIFNDELENGYIMIFEEGSSYSFNLAMDTVFQYYIE